MNIKSIFGMIGDVLGGLAGVLGGLVSVGVLSQIVFGSGWLGIPIKEDKGAFPHIDHSFPHKNLIIYLNDPAGGDTVLVDKDYKEIDRHHPKEDDIISFEGIHYQKMPKEGRRIVLVVTYI